MIPLFALLFHSPNTGENWIFVIEYIFLLDCNYFRNHLEPYRVYTWTIEPYYDGMVRFQMEPFQTEPFHFL